MEGLLQAVIIIFMLFLCSLCLFAVVVIVRDIIHENAKARREKELEERKAAVDREELASLIAQATALVNEEKAQEPEPVVEDILLEEPTVEPVAEPQVEEDETAVVFSRQTLTIEERYDTLSSEFKRHFDDIIRHAMGKEGVRELKYGNYYDYKIGSYKVLRISIKRGEIVCEFQFLDRDFLDYANSSNVKMKQSATSIRISEPAAVGAVKDGIDLVCTQIAEDKEHKKALAREKRREKRRKEKEENIALTADAEGGREEEALNV